MVSAAAPEGVICRRETRGGAGSAGRMATHTSVPTIAPLAMIAATPTSATRRHCATTAGAAVCGTAVSNAPSSASRTSPMACTRCLGSFCRQRLR